MLKKRIIPCLDIREGRTVKGVNFVDIRDAGDPVELAQRYVQEGADELVFLDITATQQKRKTLVELVKKIAREINIPFTVGGGVQTIEDARAIIRAGADKISVNSAAVKNPFLIQDIAREFGSQCVVLAMDIKQENGAWKVYVSGGKIPTDLEAVTWAKQAVTLGAGEILLTSMDHDGTKKGFAIEITARIASSVGVPVIASGGAGVREHFKDIFQKSTASGALAASVFHFGEIPIPSLKNYLSQAKIPMR